MRDAVRNAFYAFNLPMEGAVPWLYQDVKGLVSIGVGILCDPIVLAMNLPLVRPDGSPASQSDIVNEWRRIKQLPPNAAGQTAAQLGHTYARRFTTLRLTDEGLRATLERKLDGMAVYLGRKRFPSFDTWPCDAQLGVLSLSWACGPAFHFPKLAIALQSRDWETAAVECFMPEERTISGLRPRNRANRLLFRNAAFVEESGWSPDTLFYPKDLHAPVNLTADTEPPRSSETSRVEVPAVRTPPLQSKTVVDFAIVRQLYPLEDPKDGGDDGAA